ncbi:inositol monophosphatase family protein [Nocardiopsis metallicus]|uniref:Fructose-1,6-bisphosphatase/inositol monophosphatase family enzyme n=1 Tax=Nocardiopsis metallicus TaxID=179819 RepID=A0A840WJ24_9ACTN|nr:inositol monophosphatase family protein [Nocardiopsis metallicus]MBB5491546.1 fructose-1,6-bisphosphatase/inositol monophosphatase family enzyme [Nocardiopsis metallicus]
MTIDFDAVTEILREAAATAVLPHFQTLREDQVSEKSPGEIVTVADREAEAIISPRLRDLLDVPVVGEEATAADPELARALRNEPAAWLVDPVDGTRNFTRGEREFAVMAALVREGRTVASWILRPTEGTLYTAELGSGAWRDGTRLHRAPAPAEPARMRGAVLSRFLSPRQREHVRAVTPEFAEVGAGAYCAGVDYPRLAEGALDFVLFNRTLPWDHAPGGLLLSEAGGVALRLEGDPYRPDDDRVGLLNAADETSWRTVRSLLLPS